MEEITYAIVYILLGWFVLQFIITAWKPVKQDIRQQKTYQLKITDETHEKTGWAIKKIMFRGKMPNKRNMEVSVAISAHDATEGKYKPIFSFVEAMQEPGTKCYQSSSSFGLVNAGSVITDWCSLGNIVPDLIQPAYSGEREIYVIVLMFNSANPPTINKGMPTGDGEVILAELLKFNFEFKDKGYEEVSKDREESQSIALKIGVAVAMADGSLDDSEGEVLKNWIKKEISGHPDSHQKTLKSLFNSSLEDGFAEVKEGTLSLSNLVARLNEIGDKKSKYEAVELCLSVMAADSVADPEEMLIIRNVAESLGLDMDEVEKMLDGVNVNLAADLTSEEGWEALIGINPLWPNEKKCKHLSTESKKCSDRLNVLPEGDERDFTQSMLDNIAKLREKYGC